MGFVDDCIMSKPEGNVKIDISALIIYLSERVPDPQPIVRLWGNLIASRGNISAVVGLAKSRKTFLTCAVASGFLADSEFMGFDTPATGRILYIDTEQARAHVHKIARRLARKLLRLACKCRTAAEIDRSDPELLEKLAESERHIREVWAEGEKEG